ncbi:MAG: ATP-binding cassette domain-containing protein [Mycobacteriales bacterium]
MAFSLDVVALDLPAQAVVVGALTGLTYALLGTGLVLVYRATRVINFAHGQIGAFCAAVLAKLVLDLHWPFFVSLAAVVVLGAGIGAAVELGVVRRLFDAPRLQLFVATLGVSQVMLVAQYLLPHVSNKHGSTIYPSPLPFSTRVFGVRLTSPELMVVFVVPVLVVGLGLFLTRTWFGLSIRASSDNGEMSELSGISTRNVSTLVWTLAGALAALTAVLLNPVRGTVVGLPSPALGAGLLMPALAAALVGRLTSLPMTLAGGVAIGVLQSILVVNYPTTPGIVDLVLFAAVLVMVLLRRAPEAGDASGRFGLTLRVTPVPEKLQRVWWTRHLGSLCAAVGVLCAALLPVFVTSASKLFLFSGVVVVALAGLSVTVLTGWAGQLSLGQYAFVGLGAVTAVSVVAHGYSFTAAIGYAAVAGTLAAVLVGFPALRVKGLFLSVTTLAFAVATQSWLLRQRVFSSGDETFFRLPRPTLFGAIPLTTQRSYYYFCLVVLVVAAAAVSRLRRTGIGRGIIAMRDNEPCAASFGLSPTVAKLSAFAFAGMIAAVAGALYAGLTGFFSLDSPNGYSPFGPEQSLQVVAMAVIGGLGSVGGTILGALYVVGLPAIFSGNPTVGFATSGIGLLVLLLYVPGGLASIAFRVRDLLLSAIDRRMPAVPAPAAPPAVKTLPRREPPEHQEPAPQFALQASGVSVQFGGLAALTDVSVTAHPGEIVGLIGSNGAGKSTLMNVISGFQPAVSGRISLWGQDVTALPPHERARLGAGRIFQDARLFADLTVRDTVKLALEVHDRTEFVPSLVGYPPARRLERQRASQAADFIDFLGLGRYADSFASDLSTGTRRILELCCLVARGSRLLLLDEPTAGVAQKETEAFGPLIKRIRAELDATVVIIQHDMPLVMSMSDRIYCMDAGQVITEGDPDSVRNDPAVVAAYLGTDERAISRSGAVAPSPALVPSWK